MNKIKKFLHEVDGHEKSDFSLNWIFLLRSFFDPWYLKKMIKKWPEPKMSKYQKICFFMPVNHTKYFLKSNHDQDFSSWQFFETLNFYFKIVWPRRLSLFRQKIFAMLMSKEDKAWRMSLFSGIILYQSQKFQCLRLPRKSYYLFSVSVVTWPIY